MRQLFTPARQLAEANSLREEAERQHRYWVGLTPAAQQEQQASAGKVTPECIEVELYTGEGWGWAVTTGTAPLLVDGREIPQALDRTVWVLSDGDWWIYNRTLEELNTYGNPPDPVIKVLQLPKQLSLQTTAQPPATPSSAAPPAASATGAPGA
jgi:hypothetical protein